MNPLLSREIRERFRDGRAFVLVLVLSAGLSLFFAWLFRQSADANLAAGATSTATSKLTGHAIFSQLAWSQTLGWFLIAPALTSSAIAYERERGWFDSLLLSSLLPRQVVLGKWAAALLYAGLLYCVTLPFLALTFLLGGVSARQFCLILILHAACALCASAIGLAASAWSPRASTALRTAYGLIFCGFGASLFGAAAAGELPFRFPAVPGENFFFTWLGRTNPLLRAIEISGDLAFQRLGTCLGFLSFLTLFFLWVATYYARRPLEEAPSIEKRAAKKKAKSTKNQAVTKNEARQSHSEIPLVSRLHFANPILDREVRAKFRMRQPPLGVIISEIILGILVAFFYARTLYWAFFEPRYRILIWVGVCFTALIVSMMSAAVMGSNAFSREREGGTWEGVQLSLLSPGEILRGKIFASLITCALFSLPVWPLLLPCVTWNAGFTAGGSGIISPLSALSCVAIGAATVWSYTFVGLWFGRNAARTGRASGQTLGLLSAFLLFWPFLESRISPQIFALFHPFVAFSTTPKANLDTVWNIVVPYCALHGIFGLAMWFLLRAFLARELVPARKSTKNEANLTNSI
ncbi:ABC-2 type transporter [Abditibacterium utsteinense]|uniref:ABC-2 type transporter n=1 Tax=Abditibacterium utsteinense TaxID=1960156 RepID=A0A2S8SUW4_9BACT|nr:ABC transporter permease subunit [Abditibacterium utsteinense]PQV64581.1 ABC-2 type transporter [Abditibacterium utsteinense]